MVDGLAFSDQPLAPPRHHVVVDQLRLNRVVQHGTYGDECMIGSCRVLTKIDQYLLYMTVLHQVDRQLAQRWQYVEVQRTAVVQQRLVSQVAPARQPLATHLLERLALLGKFGRDPRIPHILRLVPFSNPGTGLLCQLAGSVVPDIREPANGIGAFDAMKPVLEGPNLRGLFDMQIHARN